MGNKPAEPAINFVAIWEEAMPKHAVDKESSSELQKSHGYAGITREEGLQNEQSVSKVSCQHVLHNVS